MTVSRNILNLLILAIAMNAMPSSGLFAQNVERVKPARIVRALEGEEEEAAEAVDEEAPAEEGQKGEINRIVGNFFKKLFDRDEPAAEAELLPAPMLNLQVPQANLKQFVDPLNQALTIEIHYLRKICRPTEEQLKPIREAGQAKILEVAQVVAKNQHNAFRDEDKSGRDLIREAVQNAARKQLPQEDYDRYAQELNQRHQARLRGVAELMSLTADQFIAVSPQQHGQFVEKIVENPEPQWTNGMRTYFYRQYSPLPEYSVLESVLKERQKAIWKQMTQSRSRSRISFGWPQNFDLQLFGSDLQLQELKSYTSDNAEEEATDDSSS